MPSDDLGISSNGGGTLAYPNTMKRDEYIRTILFCEWENSFRRKLSAAKNREKRKIFLIGRWHLPFAFRTIWLVWAVCMTVWGAERWDIFEFRLYDIFVSFVGVCVLARSPEYTLYIFIWKKKVSNKLRNWRAVCARLRVSSADSWVERQTQYMHNTTNIDTVWVCALCSFTFAICIGAKQ